MAHPHRADHVHREQRRGRVGAHVLEANGVRLVEAPGRVHEHVDPPVQGVRLLNEASDRSLIGDVELMGRGGAAGSDDLGRHRLGFALRAPVADEDRRALPAEPTRDRPAQRPAGTGHKCNAPRESMAVVPGRLHDTPQLDCRETVSRRRRAAQLPGPGARMLFQP